MKRTYRMVPEVAAGLVAAWVSTAAGPALAQCEVNKQFAPAPAEKITVYTAKKILTMERGNPEAAGKEH